MLSLGLHIPSGSSLPRSSCTSYKAERLLTLHRRLKERSPIGSLWRLSRNRVRRWTRSLGMENRSCLHIDYSSECLWGRFATVLTYILRFGSRCWRVKRCLGAVTRAGRRWRQLSRSRRSMCDRALVYVEVCTLLY